MKNILLVEDDESFQFFVKEVLGEERFNCGLEIAATGEDGVEKARSLKPDIAIVDSTLPGMDGFETCKKIKELCGGSTKVIILAGAANEIDGAKAREMGADEYLAKPSDLGELGEILRRLVG